MQTAVCYSKLKGMLAHNSLSYEEFIPYLYTKRRFEFGALFESHQFLTTIRLPVLHIISRLHIQWPIRPGKYAEDENPDAKSLISKLWGFEEQKRWTEICQILQRMDGLEELVIRIFCSYASGWGLFEYIILQPLGGIKMKEGGKGLIVELPCEDIPHAAYPHCPVDEWGNPKSLDTLGLRVFRREGKDNFGQHQFGNLGPRSRYRYLRDARSTSTPWSQKLAGVLKKKKAPSRET
jgi:hypothetical protein